MDNNIFVLGPVFIPLLGAFVSLLSSRNNLYQRYIGVAAIFVAWLSSAIVLYQNWDEQAIQVYNIAEWNPPYDIILVADMLSGLFGFMATSVLLGGILYTLQCHDKSVTYPVFIPMFLTMSTGLNGALYTGDIFTMFTFIELMVISSVVLVAISDNRFGVEAAMKYLVISAMGSLVLLIGIAAVYTTLATLNMADIASLLQTGERFLLARAAAVMLMAAFLLKSAVFPFHFWQPDFHTTAPTPVGAMLSSVVVKVGIYGVIRVVTLLFVEESDTIEGVLVVLGLIGIFFGSLAALRTYNAKRMLAYSTFGQIGFILVGIGWGTPLALVGAIVYAFNHAFIKSSLLMLTGIVSSHTKIKTGAFSDLIGAGKSLPFTGTLYFLGGIALSGVPPMNGFISKLALVRGGIDARAWGSVGLAVGAGVLTLLYMTRAWALMFQRQPDDTTADLKPAGAGDSPLGPALLIGACVLLGVYAGPLMDLAQYTVAQIGDPNLYIRAVLGG